jgi:hypothetical protein
MKKIIIVLLCLIPLFGISQTTRVLNEQYNDGQSFGKPLKDTVRALVAGSNVTISNGGSSLVDTISAVYAPQTLTTLTDASTVTWDYSTMTREAKVTLGGNRTLSITNLPAGKVVYLTLGVIQDGTGSRTLALPAGTKVIKGGAGVVTLTATANAVDILSFRWNGVTLYCTYGNNYN